MKRDRSPLFALVFVTALVVLMPGCAAASVPCNRYAAPNGRDNAGGSSRSPFRTVQRLVESLHAGQVGCLREGTYYGDVGFRRGGHRGAPVSLRPVPGDAATVVGRVWIPKGVNWVDVSYLHLDGRNGPQLPSPTVNSDNDQFTYDYVTNDHTAICFELGSGPPYGMARNTLIEHNRIHDCGVLPATNHDHGIYVANSVGARIIDNWIYDNADRGVQLYWNAQHTTIAGNVIDHNGEGVIISGDQGHVSSHNLIIGNAITNSTQRADVESYWPTSAKGHANLVIGNCVFGGRKTIDMSGGGFVARDNLTMDPHYVDPAAGDYSLPSGTVCNNLLNHATDVRGRSAAIIRAVHTFRPRLRLWLHAHLRRRGRGRLLVIHGGLARHSMRVGNESVGVDIWTGHRWRRIATVRARRNGSFRLTRRLRHSGRHLRIRVRAYGRGQVGTRMAWA
jgi:Right handed beta helix region